MHVGPRKLNLWELGAAALLFLFGAFIAWQGSAFPFGSLSRIGPGFFPIVIGVLLMLLSAAIMLEVRFHATEAPDIPLRPLAAILAGMVVFAALVERAGLVPATFLLVVLASLGDRAMTPLRALAVAVSVSALGYAVFGLGFRLPVDPFWW